MGDAEFKRILGREIFGSAESEAGVADLLFVQESWFSESDWFTPAPLVNPARLKERTAREKWPAERMDRYRARVERLREIERRYRNSTHAAEREMQRIARLIVVRWDRETL